MPDIFIGIDLGTTVLKAAAFDAAGGKMLAASSRSVKTIVDPDGARSQTPDGILRALTRVLADIRESLNQRWVSVAGIGLGAQGGSAVIADAKTGRALTPMYPWNDIRHYPYMAAVRSAKPRSFWRRLAMRDEPGMGLARLAWIKDTHPDWIQESNIYAGAGEYVYFYLTGIWRQDAGNAVQIGCYDVRKRRCVAEPLNIIGVPPAFIAPMRHEHDTRPLSATAAKRFQLPAGLPVAGPYMDHEAGYLSARGVSEHPLNCSLGTAWVGNFIMPPAAKWTSPFQLVIPSPIGDGWQVVQPLRTGNVNWNWGLTAFVDRSLKKAIRRLDAIFSQALLPPNGLICVPWMDRANPFGEDLYGAGAFVGLNPGATKTDMLRALMAGMCFEFFRVFSALHERRTVDAVTLGGGAGKGRFFRTMFAALFDPIPVFTFDDDDFAGARGAVYPFSLKVSQCRARPVPLPGSEWNDAIRDSFAHYAKVFTKLYGDVPVGGAIRMG